jgi:hypothetical protein
MLGGGVSLGLMDSEFSFNETVAIQGLGRQSHIGRDRENAFLYGGYVRGQVNFHLSKRASLFGGVEFNHLGAFDQTVAGKNAHLNLGAGVYLSGGFGLSF